MSKQKFVHDEYNEKLYHLRADIKWNARLSVKL